VPASDSCRKYSSKDECHLLPLPRYLYPQSNFRPRRNPFNSPKDNARIAVCYGSTSSCLNDCVDPKMPKPASRDDGCRAELTKVTNTTCRNSCNTLFLRISKYFTINKSSAVAEMGDRGHSRHNIFKRRKRPFRKLHVLSHCESLTTLCCNGVAGLTSVHRPCMPPAASFPRDTLDLRESAYCPENTLKVVPALDCKVENFVADEHHEPIQGNRRNSR